ncbi:MAG TPA: hypothetical protein PLD37_04420 [Usitatibacteraceae bacterium]|nr:hypothetical protein [Usitatibacteraceae bacterium]
MVLEHGDVQERGRGPVQAGREVADAKAALGVRCISEGDGRPGGRVSGGPVEVGFEDLVAGMVSRVLHREEAAAADLRRVRRAEGFGATAGLDGFFRKTRVGAEIGEVDPGDGERRIGGDGAVEGLAGFEKRSRPQAQRTEHVPGAGIGGIGTGGRLQHGLGFRLPALVHEGPREIVQGLAVIRLRVERPADGRFGFAGAPRGKKGDREIVPRARVAGTGLGGHSQVRGGFSGLAVVHEGLAQACVGRNERGVDREGTAPRRDRVASVTAPLEHIAQGVEIVAALGQGDGLPQGGFGGIEVSAFRPHESDAKARLPPPRERRPQPAHSRPAPRTIVPHGGGLPVPPVPRRDRPQPPSRRPRPASQRCARRTSP